MSSIPNLPFTNLCPHFVQVYYKTKTISEKTGDNSQSITLNESSKPLDIVRASIPLEKRGEISICKQRITGVLNLPLPREGHVLIVPEVDKLALMTLGRTEDIVSPYTYWANFFGMTFLETRREVTLKARSEDTKPWSMSNRIPKFVNLTKHDITIEADSKEKQYLIPCNFLKDAAFEEDVNYTSRPVDHPDLTCYLTSERTIRGVKNLPPPEDGTTLIVYEEVFRIFSALGRKDLAFPDPTAIKSKADGCPIYRGLVNDIEYTEKAYHDVAESFLVKKSPKVIAKQPIAIGSPPKASSQVKQQPKWDVSNQMSFVAGVVGAVVLTLIFKALNK